MTIDTSAATAPMRHAEPRTPAAQDRMRVAAFRATRLYPGPVGELVSRELLSWAEFGHRLGGHGFAARLTDAILTPHP